MFQWEDIWSPGSLLYRMYAGEESERGVRRHGVRQLWKRRDIFGPINELYALWSKHLRQRELAGNCVLGLRSRPVLERGVDNV